ncbi:MAG: hypothetical protein ACR2I8_03495 [Steroidobacteraceae bacterium]
MHNLHYYLALMARMRRALDEGTFAAFLAGFLAGPEAQGGVADPRV